MDPNDGCSKCECERCLEREEKYGSYAGVVIEFANYIAEEMAEDAVSDNPEFSASARQERLMAEAGEAWPFCRDELLDRLEENYNALLQKHGGARAHYDMFGRRVENLRGNTPPAPNGFWCQI